jgi:predicted 2-oxoglutarate/Fe(II)-dependent dioxygenase YbiX
MTIQNFKDYGYVHLKNALDKQSCEILTNELKALVELKKTIKDEQCPLSEAVHGSEIFDNLLIAMLPYFEEQSGLKLYPTYSYARLYNTQGEELKNHRDRPACEISATITLGFEGDVWAIYIGNNEDKSNGTKIEMDVGDAVMYRGMDKWHWREPYFEGKWQAQVFLHYVDQNGPHAEWKYDKRESLGISKTQEKSNSFDICYIMPEVLSKEFCNKLIEEYTKPEVDKELPFIGEGRDLEKNINLNIRNTKRVSLPLNKGVGATLSTIGLNMNNQLWKYNITHSNQAEFLIYDIGGKYEAHVDTFHAHSNETRKITILAILNDDFEGGKFYVMNGSEKVYPKQNKGDVIIFPSFMVHGVEPVTKGIRYTVVNWMVGPYFV